jgi:hypothetical protein
MAEISATLAETSIARALDWPRVRDLPLDSVFVEALAVLLLVPVLLSVALWNGFPLTFYDTGAYLLEGLGHHFLLERSPGYSLFLRFGGGAYSLWIIVIFQAVITAFVMTQAARVIAPRIGLFLLLGIGALLTFFTGIAWYAGQLEPDCLAPLVPLALYLMAFHRRAFGPLRTALLFGIASFGAFAHTSNLALALGLVLFLTGPRAVQSCRRKERSSLAPNIVLPAASVATALLLVVAANAMFTGRLFVSRAAPAFVFARILQDGIANRLLDDTCPQSGYKLCAYRDRLPKTADAWLWEKVSPFNRLGRFRGAEPELARMVDDSLARYPLMHAEAAAKDALLQFSAFRTGDQIESQRWVLDRDFVRFLPQQRTEYDAARQQRVPFDFAALNLLHVPVGWLSLMGLFAALAFGLTNARREVTLLPLVLAVALMGNAIICGVFSNPHDRYQSRLMWLPAFVLLLMAADGSVPRLWTRDESGT